MRYDEKKEKITSLNESDLRRQVIIPLLKASGFMEVHEFHGSTEKGKDILFREASKLGESFAHAVVASTENISGKVGDSKSASRILEQAEMAFNETYQDKYTGGRMRVERCWIITSGTIAPPAIESIAGKLEKYNLDKFVRFIDVEKLIELIEQYYPQFWERKGESVSYSKFERIDISTNKLDSPYDRDVDDLSAAGNLKDTLYRIKKSVYSVLLECDYDLRDKLAEILKTNHPWKVISIWEELRGDRIDRSGHIYLSSEIEKIQHEWQYLLDDLRQYEERFEIKPEDRKLEGSSA